MGKMATIIFGNRCPVCLQGAIFSGIYSMHRACQRCGYVYEREPGYFLGAMISSYFLGAMLLVPILVIGIFALHLEIQSVVAVAIVSVLAMNPILFRFSRLVWIAAETRMSQRLDSGDSGK
jgi:uncharacterized protein (DUF983 family)